MRRHQMQMQIHFVNARKRRGGAARLHPRTQEPQHNVHDTVNVNATATANSISTQEQQQPLKETERRVASTTVVGTLLPPQVQVVSLASAGTDADGGSPIVSISAVSVNITAATAGQHHITLAPPNAASPTSSTITNTSTIPIAVTSFRSVATVSPNASIVCAASGTSHWNLTAVGLKSSIRRK